jgi:hypothetical protein
LDQLLFILQEVEVVVDIKIVAEVLVDWVVAEILLPVDLQ